MKAKRIISVSRTHPLSLFSFLDILGGTIGILILVISVFIVQLKTGSQIVQMFAETSKEQPSTASYIICNGGGMVEIHEEGKSYRTSIEDLRIAALLENIKKSSGKRYLILGVRPNGFADFEMLRTRGESAGIDLGYEPLDEGWRIRAPGGKLL